MGKTTLVQEAAAWTEGEPGLFLTGKFDQSAGDQPYTAFVGLVQDFCRQVEGTPGAVVWAGRLRDALKDNLDVLTALVPELGRLTETEGRPPLLAPKENEDRFTYTWRTFLRALGPHQGTPLTLFFDDVQWIDSASERLLAAVAKGLDGILVLASCREPVPVLGPLTTGPVIEIGPLDLGAVNQLVEECLGTVHGTGSLASILHEKTGGSPFFLLQLLQTLWGQGQLRYEPTARGWTWDPAYLRRMETSRQVADLLAAQLRERDAEDQFWLGAASCLGPTFLVDDLRRCANDRPTAGLGARLWTLIEARFLAPTDETYLGLQAADGTGAPVRLKFAHDRIRQAAADLFGVSEQKRIHRLVGSTLIGEGRLVEAAVHRLTAGPIRGSEEAQVFLEAAVQARASSAHHQALEFLKAAREAGPIDEVPVLHLLAESAFLCREVDLGEQASREWADRLPPGPARAEVFLMQMDAFTFLGQMPRAMDRGRLALEALGFRLPLRPSAVTVAVALAGVLGRLSRKPERLAAAGEVSPEVQRTMRLLGKFLIPAFMTGNTGLFALSTLRAAALALDHPACRESAGAYANLAILLSGLGRQRQAFAFASLALKIEAQFPNPATSPAVHSAYTLFCLPWNRPWNEFAPEARRTADIAVAHGDLFILANQLCFGTIFAVYPNLDEAITRAEGILGEVAATGHEDAWTGTKLALQRWKSLAGRLPQDLDFSEGDFVAVRALADWKARGNLSGPATYHLFLTEAAVVFGEWDRAWTEWTEARRFQSALAGSAYMADYCLFSFLLAAEFADHPQRGRLARSVLKTERRRMAAWSRTCPENFLMLRVLMDAETARTQGRYAQARERLTQALALADREVHQRNRALVLERAARFHRFHGDPLFANHLTADAYRVYSAWGAQGKTARMTREHRNLQGIGPQSGDPSAPGRLDLESLVQVTQAVTREIDPTRLLEVVVPAVVENAGAQTGWLMLRAGDGWRAVARADAAGACQVFSEPRSPDDEGIPQAVLSLELTRAPGLVIGRASDDPRWPGVPTGTHREVVSVLALAFSTPGNRPTALWYLENNLFEGAFSAQRLEMLGLLSTQVAIALENARIYGQLQELNRDLERKVRERTEVIEERNLQLEGGLEYAGVLQRTLLPRDWRSGARDGFCLWLPRDPVGGDLFWTKHEPEGGLLAVVDCTGHGIPGALLTMIVHGLLEEAAPTVPQGDLAALVRTVNGRFRHTLRQQRAEGGANDGFDLGLLWWSRLESVVRFTGSRIGLLRQGAGPGLWIPGERTSLGYSDTPDPCPVRVHEWPLVPGERLYLTTDGLLTQTGGAEGIAFGKDRFARLISELQPLTLAAHENELRRALEDYRGARPQQDDITVAAVEL